MKYTIHIINNDYHLIHLIYNTFKSHYSQHEFDVRKYTPKDEQKLQLLEEQVEHQAFTNLKEIMELNKNDIDNSEHIFIGLANGIKKDMLEEEDNNVLYYGIYHILIFNKGLIYTNESDKVYIKTEYNKLINESQSNNKIIFAEKLKEFLNKKDYEEDNWFSEMDPRRNKFNLVENMMNELLDNINLN